MSRFNRTPKDHRPNAQVFDYKTQRLARGGGLKTIVVGVAAGLVGFSLGVDYVAHSLFPSYAWTDAFIKNPHGWWFTVDGWRAYNPLLFIRPILFNLKYPAIHKALYYAGLPAVMLGVLAGGIVGLKHKDAREAVMKNPVHGSAHWAARKDAVDAALLPPAPKTPWWHFWGDYPAPEKFDSQHICYVGGFVEKGKMVPLQHTGAEHIIAFAPTRSGKGVGLVLPTLLDGWLDSVVVHDIKGENYLLTAGYRKSIGNEILKFNPGDPSEDGCHFNPLDAVRVGTEYEVKDVMNIATMIVDPDGKGLNDHWQKTGFALLTSVILHVLYAMPDKTLRGVAAFLNNPALKEVDDAFLMMMNTEHDPDEVFHWLDGLNQPTKVHPVIAQSAKEMLNKADNEKSGVISTMMSFLSLYRDPIVAKWTEYSDFKIKDLQDHEKPVSLYLVTSPEDKNRLKPLIRLILNQIASQFTSADRLVNSKGRMSSVAKHRLLLLLDEFPSLGKMDVFQDTIAFLAGYNVKLYLITQDMAQLEDEGHGYGKAGAKIIIGNAHIRVIYAPNQIETAKWVSDMLGTTTVTLENDNQSFDGSILAQNKGYSTSVNYQSRPLLTADEVLTLKGPVKDGSNIKVPGDMIVLAAGFSPIYGQQLLYFKNPEWLARAQIEPPAKSDVTSGKKEYDMLGPNKGVLPQPEIVDDDEEASAGSTPAPAAAPKQLEDLPDEALAASLDKELAELEAAAADEGEKPNGEGKYDTGERDKDRESFGELV